MTLLPHPWWVPLILAAVLLGDVLLSLRPPAFIRDCLNGVRFPREWWWTLIVIKSLAVLGLVVGTRVAGLGLAANVGVVVYFLCAGATHLRARFLGQAFWVNCLGFFALGLVSLLIGFA